MKVLAIDYGTRRVGLAIGDENLRIVSPKGVIKTEKALEEIKAIVKTSNVGKIVLGFPLTPSGKEGQRAKLVKKFYEELKRELPDIEIILWDERWTTQEALRRLEGMSSRKKKQLKDTIAAMVILEEYFDSI